MDISKQQEEKKKVEESLGVKLYTTKNSKEPFQGLEKPIEKKQGP